LIIKVTIHSTLSLDIFQLLFHLLTTDLRFRPKINAVIAARIAARKDAATTGRDEIALVNAQFIASLTESVEGREAELARIANYIDAGIVSHHSKLRSARDGTQSVFVVAGPPGIGKSTLLAEAAKRMKAAMQSAVVISYFIGVTPGSGTAQTFLTELRSRLQTEFLSSNSPTDQGRHSNDEEDNQTVTSLPWLMASSASGLKKLLISPDRPLILMIDALDQLSAEPLSTAWIPDQLAANIRLVVSVPADRPEFAELSALVPANNILMVPPVLAT
jgi:AAA ATPase-like protein